MDLNGIMMAPMRRDPRTREALARYARTEYGTDDPTWLLTELRAPTRRARSFSPHREGHRHGLIHRAARAFATILLLRGEG